MARRHVGIDLAKRSMQVCILEDGRITRHSLKTDAKGREILCALLRKSDVVGMEVCGYANTLARAIGREVGCVAHLLNPGSLVQVWKSQKKTDKEDALKIAKYVRDTPEDNMASVPLLSEEEEAFRSDISMKEFLKRERTAAINRLHALYGQIGIIDVTRADLKDEAGRKKRRAGLPPSLTRYAEILEEQLVMIEKQLAEMREKVREKTRAHELAPYVMSIPGIGIDIAAVLLAYIGDGRRFDKPGEVANYAGLTPKVDCSGETKRYGSIARFTFCHAIRSVLIEGVWAMARSQNGGTLLAKYVALSGRMGKKKSAVAVARKMVTLAWLLMKRKEYCNWVSESDLEKKLLSYKIRLQKRE